MPDYLAHQVFGEMVMQVLPQRIRSVLEKERNGWSCGLSGPDPLMFYRLLEIDPLTREGHLLHRETPTAALERLRKANCPQAIGYAAGYLCHYMLDAVCHPGIEKMAKGSHLRHMMIEGALDRLLAERFGERTLKMPTDAALRAAGLSSEQADLRQMKAAWRHFRWVIRLTALFRCMTPIGKQRRLAAYILYMQMMRLVPDCAAQITQLVDGMSRGEVPCFAFQVDFHGKVIAP